MQVRTTDGELQFADLPAVREALRMGLVDAADELQQEQGGEWQRVGAALGGGRPHFTWKAHYHWYVMAPLYVLSLVGGLLWFAFVVSSHLLWLAFVRPGYSRRR